MKQNRKFLVVLLGVGLVLTNSLPAQLYWDTNGATAGAGNPANGTWNNTGTNAVWSTTAAGDIATVGYTIGSDVVFSAGTDAATAAVSLGASVSANSVTFQEGAITITNTSSNTLSVGSGGITLDSTSGPVSISRVNLNASTAITEVTLDADGAASGLQLTLGASGGSYARSGIVMISGHNLGLNATGTADSANVFFGAAAPTLTGAGAVNTTTRGIIARTFGTDLETGTVGFVTYDTNGVRLLNSSEYLVNNLTAGQNVVINGSTANSGNKSLNSLNIAAGGQITGSGTLTLASGDLLVSGVNSGISTGLSTSNGLTITALEDLTSTAGVSGGAAFAKYGSGTVSFGGAIDATVTVHEGVLIANGGDKIKTTTINPNGTLRLNANNSVLDTSSIGVNGALEYAAGVSDSFGSLNGSGTVTGLAGVTAASMSVTGGTFSGAITGNLNYTMRGTGTATLSGANSHTGSTNVTGTGTLLVTGTLTGTSGVSVSNGTFHYNNASTGLNRDVTVNGGVFRYSSTAAYTGNLTFTSGKITGTGNLSQTAMTIGAGQILAPGNSPGNQDVGAQTWLGGGIYEFEINNTVGSLGVNWDHLTIDGALDLSSLTSGNPFIIELISLTTLNAAGLLTGFDELQNYSWQIATFDSLTGTFSSNLFEVDTTGFANTFTGQFFVTQNGNALELNYTAVPEPSTYAMLAAGLGALYFLRRKRKA